MNKQKTQKNKTLEISKAFVKYGSDFISPAGNIEIARNLAYFAVVAWNISLYPKDQIPKKIDLVAREYETSNPGVIKGDLLAQDLQRLVGKKLEDYPDIRRTITEIGVEEKGEEYEITIASVHFEFQ